MQDVRVGSMDSNGTGVLATYRNAAERRYNAHGTDTHLLWAEFRFTPLASFRVGHQDLKLGPEVMYPEADWRYLKSARLGERLIGSVGFSHEERAADDITVRADFGGHNLFVFAAQPTTGVFEVDQAYRPLHDVTYESAQWTVKRGTWLADTEPAVRLHPGGASLLGTARPRCGQAPAWKARPGRRPRHASCSAPT